MAQVRILVTGATGFVGRALVPALLDAGHDVLAATRHPDSYDGPGKAVGLDVSDADSVADGLEGCDAAYFLVHSMVGGDFATKDRKAAEAFARAARAAGTRVVYLGGLGDPEDTTSTHLRSRHEVGQVLRSGSDTVELRAAIVIGRGGASFEILRQLVNRLPAMICPAWVTTRCQPIALDDAVRYLVGALDIPAGTYDIGGPEVLTYEEMMRRYAHITGRRRLIVKVPFLTPGLSSHWIGVVTDQSAAVARPLAEGLSVEVVADDAPIRRLLPGTLIDFDEAVRRALGDARA